MRWTKHVLSMMFVLLLSFCSSAAQAEQGVGFYVTPVLPSNQMNAQIGYFSLLTKPGHQQEIKVLLTNLTDEEIHVSTEANIAFTNQNGVIAYSDTERLDPLPLADFTQWITPVSPLVTIPASGTATAAFLLEIPEEPFEGDWLGGLTFVRVPKEKDESKDNAKAPPDGIVIKNVYIYSVAVHLTQSTQIVTPDFEIAAAWMDKVAGYPALRLDIRNLKPLIVTGATLGVEIFLENGETPLYSFTSPIAMAPDTAFHYTKAFPETLPLAKGAYRIKATLSFAEEIRTFELPLHIE